ncbi:MAG: acetyl-CoA carboxylase biotin carboxyl carrier protein subunit, partial [Clostridiales bacterium]|nr:acetyl-CoA carboxylase biotin carboxyl carrier protein subunit [Clostridiales bacterium]
TKVVSPMPGNILSVNIAVGDTVKKGQVLMVLEAMKMENEIMADCDGVVASVDAAKGAAVETGSLLCVLR